MPLDSGDKRRLRDDGFLLLEHAVEPDRVAAALRTINRSLGARGMPPERLSEMRARTFCPDAVEAPEIVALFGQTALGRIAQEAIGQGRVRPPSRGQIALRFPQPAPAPAASPHLDGMYTPQNGVLPGKLSHFTALAGVFLSDALVPDVGNFTVWPGSHRTIEAHCRARGPASVLQDFSRLEWPDPRPLLVRAGDAVLTHYALVHGVAPNFGPHVRYAVFFRLFHVDHHPEDERGLTDLWGSWDGLRASAT